MGSSTVPTVPMRLEAYVRTMFVPKIRLNAITVPAYQKQMCVTKSRTASTKVTNSKPHVMEISMQQTSARIFFDFLTFFFIYQTHFTRYKSLRGRANTKIFNTKKNKDTYNEKLY